MRSAQVVGLAVHDVRDDAGVPDLRGIRERLVGEAADFWTPYRDWHRPVGGPLSRRKDGPITRNADFSVHGRRHRTQLSSGTMASTWGSIGRKLGDFAVAQGPKLLKQLQNSGTVKRATEAISGSGHPGSSPAAPSHTLRRPPRTAPAGSNTPQPRRAGRSGRGRLDVGRLRRGPASGKDRPVLVVGRDGHTLLGLMLSSNRERDDDRNWLALGTGTWDSEHRPSWVRLDRVLDVPEAGIRREGAILDRPRFEAIAARLRSDYSWS